MGFAAHHAIHHMAMVKIIATQTVGLSKEELSPDFGRAPSTIVYDTTLSNDANHQ
jgi:predicted Fe-Mo cluster-binding NifX family protein